MPCPFLKRLSSTYVRNYGASLIRTYGEYCPIMSRLVGTAAPADANSPALEGMKKCPFLAEAVPVVKEASKEMKDDIIDLTPKAKSERQIGKGSPDEYCETLVESKSLGSKEKSKSGGI
ncbi:hypothetical protein J437_LFUL017817 [Ladona fulva]|uniref:5-aminolevulinate synthase presequence domain-containing protein n=1 Tax=Ladona fulva TaxID=123851 RepID=A0A8K0KPY7_LADFU|nr:hypothetical protein J437_LFUL017817 [Ladona fulva]